MSDFRTLSSSEQLAEKLKGELLRRSWVEVMPGEKRLMEQFAVGQGTVRAALAQLESEGVLKSVGQGKRRRIVSIENIDPPALRIKILHYEPSDLMLHYLVDVLHLLLKAGHAASFASKSLVELGEDLGRVSSYINQTPADAWMVVSGPRDLMEWCSQQEIPIFALAGRRRGLNIAGTGPNKEPALHEALDRLIQLGHRRIVMLARKVRRVPKPGQFEQAFLEYLASHDISVSQAYNLPDWEDNADGLHRIVDSLFALTPPTALIIGELNLFYAVQAHLAQRHILAPRDVSLICDDPHPAFEWCQPSVAHIHWQSSRWSQRVSRWAECVARGRSDRSQNFTKSRFVDGGTVGPPPQKGL